MGETDMLISVLLGLSLATAVHAGIGFPLPSEDIGCGTLSQKIGGCPTIHGQIGEGTVAIVGSDSQASHGSGGNGAPDRGRGDVAPDPDAWNEEQARANGNYHGVYEVVNPATPPRVVTLNDIANFAPAVEGNHMEPNGWIVVGLDTNFYSDAGPRVVEGSLLGQPAAVRFTPVAWRWAYGDGASKSSTSPGASWASLNLREFDPTPTSHVFAAPGSYAIDLTVEYSAEYQFAGTGWVGIAGTIELPANRIVATASDANTVLVNRDCRQNPGGPGC